MEVHKHHFGSTNTALVAALVGLVATALLVNVGFWAAIARAEALAGALKVSVLAAALFTVSTFAMGAAVHWVRVLRRRV